jgi:hypothetical protein
MLDIDDIYGPSIAYVNGIAVISRRQQCSSTSVPLILGPPRRSEIILPFRPGEQAQVARDKRQFRRQFPTASLRLSRFAATPRDLNSVIADPLFVAPQQCDFRLQSNSPAIKLGFKPIDRSYVGVRPKSKRTSD